MSKRKPRPNMYADSDETVDMYTYAAKRLGMPRTKVLRYVITEHLARPALADFVENAKHLPAPMQDDEHLPTGDGGHVTGREIRERYEEFMRQANQHRD